MHRIFGTDKGYRKLKALKRNEDHSENIVREADNLVTEGCIKNFLESNCLDISFDQQQKSDGSLDNNGGQS
jgi:hypothetical protein